MPYKDPAAEKARSARYYQEHREERLAYVAKYRQEHREEILAYATQYYWEHHEEKAAKAAKRYLGHREEVLAKVAKYQQEHREKSNAANARYYKEHPEKTLARNAKRRALKRGASVGIVDYAAIMERDKMRCGLCSKKVKPTEMHFDHIVPLSQGGPHTEYNLQVSHATCNMRKHAGKLASQTRLAFETA